MRKTLIILLLFVALASKAYSQNDVKRTAPSIECQIDSVIKKYDIKDIAVTSVNGMSIDYTTDFHFENGFLVVQKQNFFNMQKLVHFRVLKGLFDKRYSMRLTFN